MATKSFLKNVNISTKSMGATFVNALNDCETANSIHVELKSNKKEVSGDESIKKIIDRLKK